MKKTVEDFEFFGKRVIVRVDLNVPINDGKISDDTRIKASVKTIKYISDKGGKVILLSHLGKIKKEEDKIKNSLKPVSIRLSELLNKNVLFVPETRGKLVDECE